MTSVPSSSTRPLVRGCSPLMTLNMVVLPAPLGPMSPVTRPGLGRDRHVVERQVAAEADGDVDCTSRSGTGDLPRRRDPGGHDRDRRAGAGRSEVELLEAEPRSISARRSAVHGTVTPIHSSGTSSIGDLAGHQRRAHGPLRPDGGPRRARRHRRRPWRPPCPSRRRRRRGAGPRRRRGRRACRSSTGVSSRSSANPSLNCGAAPLGCLPRLMPIRPGVIGLDLGERRPRWR